MAPNSLEELEALAAQNLELKRRIEIAKTISMPDDPACETYAFRNGWLAAENAIMRVLDLPLTPPLHYEW